MSISSYEIERLKCNAHVIFGLLGNYSSSIHVWIFLTSIKLILENLQYFSVGYKVFLGVIFPYASLFSITVPFIFQSAWIIPLFQPQSLLVNVITDCCKKYFCKYLIFISHKIAIKHELENCLTVCLSHSTDSIIWYVNYLWHIIKLRCAAEILCICGDKQKCVNNCNNCRKLIHETDPQSWPVVITTFARVLSVPTFRNIAKQNNFQVRIVIATGFGRVDHWWHTCLVLFLTWRSLQEVRACKPF